MPERVDTREGGRILAQRILAPRPRPLVVVSTRFGEADTVIDADLIERSVGELADVVVLVTGDVSRVVDEMLPDRLQVYGGAGRSYPVDIGSDPDIRRSPLRFPTQDATERLITDALVHAQAAGIRTQAPKSAKRARGKVIGFAAGRALVALDSGGMAGIWQELTWPPIPVEWVVAKSQEVEGVVDPATSRMDLDQDPVGSEDIERTFPHRSVTLGLVTDVSGDRARIALHPSFTVSITRSDVSPNERDQLRYLLQEGEVVAVRVLHLSGSVIHVQLWDVDDDELVLPPMPLVIGGPPWLAEGRDLREDPVIEASEVEESERLLIEIPADEREAPTDEADAELEPDVLPEASVLHASDAEPTAEILSPAQRRNALQATQFALEAARAENARLLARLSDAGADDSDLGRLRADASAQRRIAASIKVELAESIREIATLKGELSEVKRSLRERAKEAPRVADVDRRAGRDRWATADAWVRHEIYLAWVERVSPSEREKWPLPEAYGLSDRFAASLDDLDDGQLDKALKAAVDVLTGRVREIPSRELHPLRTSDAGGAPAYVRHDGARAFRVYIEQNTPAARRLHFWQKPDGSVELERIVTHDVVEP